MIRGSKSSRFVLVGVFNTLLDFSILNALVFVFALPAVGANIISSSIAMVASYILNHKFVFKEQGKHSAKQFAVFVTITAFGLFVLGSIGIKVLTSYFTWPGDTLYSVARWLFNDTFSRKFIRVNFAKLAVAVVTMVWNFQMYKRFVFKKTDI